MLDEKIDKRDWIKKADITQLQDLDHKMYQMFQELPTIYADRIQN